MAKPGTLIQRFCPCGIIFRTVIQRFFHGKLVFPVQPAPKINELTSLAAEGEKPIRSDRVIPRKNVLFANRAVHGWAPMRLNSQPLEDLDDFNGFADDLFALGSGAFVSEAGLLSAAGFASVAGGLAVLSVAVFASPVDFASVEAEGATSDLAALLYASLR